MARTSTSPAATIAQPGQGRFDDLGTPLFDVTFCVVDLETTGASPSDCAITEIGAVKVQGGEVVGTFQTLVDPGGPIPPFITVLTGITQAMVLRAPPIETALPAFLEFCGDAVVVGHNVRFDLGFLDAAAVELGYGKLGNRAVDTVGLARRLVRSEVRDLRLATLSDHFRSPVAPTHRALDDARATVHVLHSLLERAGTVGVTALEDLLALPTSKGSPDYRKIELARALPRRPGVYLMRDRDGTVFYVGKAKNLRTRVMSYFHGDGRRSVSTMLRELDHIDHIDCATELEAAITELRLIHAHRPRHNRASRPSRSDHWVTLTGGPFPRLSLTRTLHVDSRLVLGPFRARRSAEQVMHALWDASPIRRCAGRPGSRTGPCAPAQLGAALCPCDGSLDPAAYRPVIDSLVGGITARPELLLERLADRMTDQAARQRFEEAAWARDRHRALARAIDRRWRWSALCCAGRVVLERMDGQTVVVDQGRFVAGWTGSAPPLLPDYAPGPVTPVPPTSAVAAEADLVWRWIEDAPCRIVDASAPLFLPAARVPTLTAA